MEKSNTIKDMYQEDRPYEKCERFGAENLTDAELLAVLLRTGTQGENSLQLAHRLIQADCSGRGILNIHRWTFDRLMRVKGIGRVKAVQILCLSELAKRMAKSAAMDRLDFSDPKTVARYYMEEMRHKEKEVIKLLLLNTKAKLIGECVISIGTVDAALVSPRDLFIEALQRNASAIILLHNHPSGDPSPSREDERITRRIYEAGALLGILLLDHIIIGDNCFISLKEQGLFR